jgi:hypothetical protein
LEQSGLKKEDIYSVEIVGGSSRIPSVKALIEKVRHPLNLMSRFSKADGNLVRIVRLCGVSIADPEC